jgi:hypothetical protein
MADAVEMGMQQSREVVWVSKRKHETKLFKLRRDFNNSDLGALDFIVDNNHR